MELPTLNTKADALALFGSTEELSRALGITRTAVYMWADRLPQRRADQILGAAVRLNLVGASNDAKTRRARSPNPPADTRPTAPARAA